MRNPILSIHEDDEFSFIYSEKMLENMNGCSFDFILYRSVEDIFVFLKHKHPEAYENLLTELQLRD